MIPQPPPGQGPIDPRGALNPPNPPGGVPAGGPPMPPGGPYAPASWPTPPSGPGAGGYPPPPPRFGPMGGPPMPFPPFMPPPRRSAGRALVLISLLILLGLSLLFNFILSVGSLG